MRDCSRDNDHISGHRGRRMRILDTRNFSVTGFKAWGIHCGIKKTDKKDLAIIYSDREAAVAGVFTRNRVKAASVLLNAAKVKSGKGQVIVANSGCANACTGKRGMADAKVTAELAAQELGVKPEAVYVASTGVIGEFLPDIENRDRYKNGGRAFVRNGMGAGSRSDHDDRHVSQTGRRAGRDRRQDGNGRGNREGIGYDSSEHGDDALLYRDRC